MNTKLVALPAPAPTGIRAANSRKNILLITPENPEIKRVRRRQLNNFTQLTMPYLAGFIDEARYRIELVDEYNQRIPYERPADIVAITVNTPNATHCYRIAERHFTKGAVFTPRQMTAEELFAGRWRQGGHGWPARHAPTG